MKRHLPALLTVLVLTAVYFGWRSERRWIPHDEGLLGHTAERVLAGELPHRDFVDTYTGGLAYLHAAAFRLFGVRLVVLRRVLLVAALFFVAALYALAARRAPPWSAAYVTVVAALWSVPVYFAALPSWYNLFCATFGAFALSRHLDTGRRRWLFVAGLAGGLSFLFKLVGLYYVAAGLLALVYREQVLAAERRSVHGLGSGPSWAYRGLLFFKLAIFVAALGWLVSRRLDLPSVVHFFLPGLALATFLAWNETRIQQGGFVERWRGLRSLTAPFLAGAVLPVAIFLVVYLRAGALGELWRGLFVLPQRRLELVPPQWPPLSAAVWSLPALLLLLAPWWARRWPERLRRRAELGVVAVATALTVWVALAELTARPYNRLWWSLRHLAPIVVLVGLGYLWRAVRRGRLGAVERQRTFLVLAVTAMVSLVQFPQSERIYLPYVAPLVVLAVLFVLPLRPRAWRRAWAALGVLYSVFAVVWLHRDLADDVRRLELDRGGLVVSATDAEIYEGLVALLDEVGAPGDVIYAGPDAPEVYFLGRRTNPTGAFFDFLEAENDDAESRRARLLQLLDEHRIDVVVLRRRPRHSRPFGPGLFALLAERYPHMRRDDHFTTFWRERFAEQGPRLGY